MQEKYNISSLFDRSGNLTLNAIGRYLNNELSCEEQALVEEHLAESEFDREALEGLKKYNAGNFSQDIADLQKEILYTASKGAKTGNFRNSGKSFWYAAAGLAGVTGLSIILFFMFRGNEEKPQLAVVQPDTVIYVRAPEKEQAVNMQLQKSEDIRENIAQNEISSPIKPDQEQPYKLTEVAAEPLLPVMNQEVAEFDQPVALSEEIVEAENDDLIIEDQMVGGVAVAEDNLSAEKMLNREEKRMATNYMTQSKSAISGGDHELPEQDADTVIFIVVETMPEFPGGDSALNRFLSDSLRYPQSLAKGKIQRKVYVSFVIEKDGSITDIRILRGIGGGCDEEAVRLIKSMPNWIPGKQRGIPVRVQYDLPVIFRLE